MRTLEITQATAPLAEYARNLDQESVIVTINGQPVAALVPIENADAETASLSTNAKFLDLIERSRKRQQTEGGIPTSGMRRRLGIG